MRALQTHGAPALSPPPPDVPASAAAMASSGDKTPLIMMGSNVTERSQGKSLAKLLLRSKSAKGGREGGLGESVL